MNYAALSYAALFRATLPETALEIAALLVIVVDLGFLRKATLPNRTAFAAIIGVAGCIAAIWAVYAAGWDGRAEGPVTIFCSQQAARQESPKSPFLVLTTFYLFATCRLWSFPGSRINAQSRRVRFCRD